MTYAGKTVVITGGATGIGRAMAAALGKEGAKVVLASTNEQRLNAAAEALRQTGAEVDIFVCDVADREQVRRLADFATKRFGPVDLLCANAGVTTRGPFLEHRDADWDWVYDVVLKGVSNCIQAFYPQMAERGQGQIMITGSQTSLAPDWVLGHGPYIAAKAAVTALAVGLRPEAAAHGVKVSLLVPASTESDILSCDRSRPGRYGDGVKGEIVLREGAPMGTEGLPFHLSADEVAERAIAGLREDAPIITTHAGMKPLAEEYFGRFLAAYDKAAAFTPASA